MEASSHGKGQRFRAKLDSQTVKSFIQLIKNSICESGHGDGVIQPLLGDSRQCYVPSSVSRLDFEDASPFCDFVKGSV